MSEPMNEHTLKFYGEELIQLKAEVVRMGGMVEAQVADCIEAVATRDVGLAQAVIGRDVKLDEMQRDIEKRAIRIIALRQPMAQDLRRAVAAMKMSLELERTGDMAKSIAKRTLAVSEAEAPASPTRSIERMGKLVVGRLREVIDAYTEENLEEAMGVWTRDAEVDENYNSLFRELLTYMMGDPRTIQSCAHLLFIGKNLERIGDHATNLAEILYYELTGEEVVGDRPKLQGFEARETAEGPAQ